LLLILFLSRGGRVPFRVSAGDATTMKWNLGIDSFRSVNLRSVGVDTTILEETVQEAAVASFRGVIGYESGHPILEAGAYSSARSGHLGDLVLRILDEDGHEIDRFAGAVPSTVTDTVAVILLLHTPSPKSYMIRVLSDTTDVVWTGGKPDSGAVTFVYSIDGRFGASRAMPFRLPKD
jgi:hypothetical protein